MKNQMETTAAEPIRILHVLGGTGPGGAESRIMDLYRQMDRNAIQFDFLVHSSAVKRAGDDASGREPQFYDREIASLGGRIYVLPKFKGYNYLTYRRAVRAFFAAHHEFRVVQGHMTSTAAVYLPIAKRAGVPVTVAHSRSAGTGRGLKALATKVMRRKLYRRADYCFACSEAAGADAFGEARVKAGRVRIIHNAVDVRKFTYNPDVRSALRRELGIEDRFVLGHVGRFYYPKNHPYLIRIFAAVCAAREDAVLVLVGDGEGRAAAQRQCEELGIGDRVLFAGNQQCPEAYYQAFDFFLLPSFYEGLPGVLVEAQAAGLRCLVSDTVTREARATDLVTYMSIDLPPEAWAQAVLAGADYERRDTCGEMCAAGFDVREQAKRYADFYLKGDCSGL